MSSEYNKLAVVDYNKTVSTRRGLPKDIVSGISHLREQGIGTTFATGNRSGPFLHRLRAETGSPGISAVVPESWPIGTSLGSNIVNQEGASLWSAPFQYEEVGELLERLRHFPISWITYSWLPRGVDDAKEEITIWLSDPHWGMTIAEEYREHATVITGSLEALSDHMAHVDVLMATVAPTLRMESYDTELSGLNVYRTPSGLYEITGTCDGHPVGKQLQQERIAEMLDMNGVELSAGNDYEDVPMVSDPMVSQPMWVGRIRPEGLPAETRYVENPHALGKALQRYEP
jgi:hypothetical protein